MNIKTNNQGIAIIIALIIVLVLIPIGLGLIYLMNPEMKFTISQNQSTRATFVAEGGANQAMSEVLVQFARVFPTNVATVSTTTLQIHADTTTYSASTTTAVQFISSYTAFNFVPATGEAIIVSSGTTDDGGVYYATASITAHPDPMGDGSVQNPIWNNASAAAQFYYRYRIESTGKIGNQIARIALDSHDISDQRKMVRKSGSFEVGLTQSLARFALCVGQMQTSSGTAVYFVGRSSGSVYTGVEFYGPVHSNGMLNILRNPHFYNNLTTAQDLINFYHAGPKNADSWGVDVPFIQAPYALSRGVAPIALPKNPADSATMKDIALKGYTTAGDGIYLPNDGTPTGGFSGTVTGGIFVEGDAEELKFKPHTYGGDDFCVYEIIQDTASKVIAINISQNETWIQDYAGWAWGAGWTKYKEQPNGVLFVDKGTGHGKINSISGTVQKDTPMTIAAMGEIKITDHLLYEDWDFDPATDDPTEKDQNKEVLGLISWDDDITISAAIPHNDLNIYGTFLTPDGQLHVEDYDQGASRGTVTLYGGMIGDFYGMFGTANNKGELLTGYARRYVWDPRFSGMAPPHYPVINNYLVTIDQNFNVYPSYQRLKK